MEKFMLFTWITLIVVLHVAADIDANGLCEKCDEANAYPECSVDNSMLQFNLTIHCQKSVEKNCTLGIVETAVEDEGSSSIIIFVCRLEESNMDLLANEFETDHIRVVPIAKEHTTETTQKEGNTEDDDMNAMPATTNVPTLTTIAANDNDSVIMNNDGSSSVANDQTIAVATSTAPENIQPSSEAAVLSEIENMALDYNDIAQNKHELENLTPNSPDYQGDEPKVEVQTPVETEHNEISVMENNALDVEPIKQIENIAEEKPTQMMTTEMLVDNTFEMTTRAAAMQKCFTCSSSNDPNCVTKPQKQIDCIKVDGTKAGCYTLLKGTVLQRGCLVDLKVNESKSCISASNTKCQICPESGCNKDPWPQCYNCSSKDEPECAWWRKGAKDIITHTLCADFKEQCLSTVDAAGITVRTCSNPNVECSKENLCELCSANLCNAGIFPAKRRRCLQCAGTIECETTENLKGLPCLFYESNDHCFLYANDTNQMIRGCTSSREEFQRCQLIGGSTKCRRCSDSDNCNDTPLKLPAKLSCSRCDNRHQNSIAINDAAEDYKTMACAWAQSTENMVNCTNTYPYYLQESCLTIYHPDMEYAVRDCSFDFGACEISDHTCQPCYENGCNSVNMKWQYCLQCSSDMEPSCATDAAKIQLKKCSATVQPYELRGCFTKKDADSNITTRGCISDLTEDGMTFCKNKTKLCTLCYEHGCNNRLATSKANGIMKQDAILVLVELVFAICFFL